MKPLQSLDGRLISFAIPNGALAAKDLPSRLKLLNWGDNATVQGVVKVGPETVRQLAANQAKYGFKDVALDFNHQTVPSSPTYKADPCPVAAYGSPEVVEGDGLYLNISEWTPSGREHAANYKDLSPTPQLDKNNEVVFLHSAALCRQGQVEGLTFYSASILNPSSLRTLTTAHPMDYRLALLALLKQAKVTLPDNPSDAEISEACTKCALPDPDADGMSVARIEKIISDRLTPMAARFEQADRDAVVARATAQGKVIPLSAEDIAQTPLKILSALVEKLPATVPLAQRGAAPVEKREGVTALSANQKEICKNMRISEDNYLKTLKADAPADLVTV